MTNTLNSRFIDESRTNTANSGYSIKVRGLQVDVSAEGDGIDSRLIVGSRNAPTFEANTTGAYFGNSHVGRIFANNSLGTTGQVLATNGSGTYWKTIVPGGPGSNLASYLQVANAVATYQTKAIERAALANTNAFIKSQLANTNAYIATKAPWSALTSTNTALRTLISDRLQVANATTLLAAKAPWSALTSTNTALRTLISDRLQVANATTLLAAKAPWSALTSTNTALRTLISDRLQVANAITLLADKATWSALTSTNTAIRTLVSDRLQVANAAALYAVKSNPATSGLLAHTGRATISTNLTVSGNTTIAGLIANGALGSANYVLKTNGTTVFWGPAGAGGPAYTGSSIPGILVTGNSTFGAAGKHMVSNGTTTANGILKVTASFQSTGNNVLGAAGKTAVIHGILASNGNVTVTKNATISGNTTSNKAVITNRFESRGNNVLGAAGKTQIVNGILASNGNITVTKNLTVSGNTNVSGSLVGAGAETTYGALTIAGTKGGWSGINFKDTAGGTNYGTLMMHPDYSGVYNNADSSWDWLWTNGVLGAGQVPAAFVTAGTFGSGNYAITGTLDLGHASDTTISRLSAGQLGVESKAIIQHTSASYASGQVTFSTSSASGGSSGDIWFKYT